MLGEWSSLPQNLCSNEALRQGAWRCRQVSCHRGNAGKFSLPSLCKITLSANLNTCFRPVCVMKTCPTGFPPFCSEHSSAPLMCLTPLSGSDLWTCSLPFSAGLILCRFLHTNFSCDKLAKGCGLKKRGFHIIVDL